MESRPPTGPGDFPALPVTDRDAEVPAPPDPGGPEAPAAAMARASSGPPARPPAPLRAWILPGLVAVLTLAVLVHLPSLRAPFFAEDYVLLDHVATRTAAQSVASPDPVGGSWHPLSRQLPFWALSRLGAGTPGAFHLAALAAFATATALLWWIVFVLGGALAATIAASYFALHYAADVPVLWAMGLQDLLTLAFALLAVGLHAAGRSRPAAVALLAALLSGNAALAAPFVAVVAAWGRGGSWRAELRRAWPLAIAVAAWAALTSFAVARGWSGGAGGGAAGPGAAAAALLHLIQVAFGFESGAERLPILRAGPVLLVATLVAGAATLAAAWTLVRASKDPAHPDGVRRPPRPGRMMAAGALWAVLATVPLVATAPTWSAHHYLFALGGVAVAVGAALAAGPRWLAPTALGVLIALSRNAGAIPGTSDAPDPLALRSHVNGPSLRRSMETCAGYLADLRDYRPALPPNSTVFFAGVPARLGWQLGDGPLVRWAYRDTSLRAYYLSQFTDERAARGPCFFFVAREDLLRELTRPGDLRDLGLSLVHGEQLAAARAVYSRALDLGPGDLLSRAWIEWIDRASGREPMPVLPGIPERLALDDLRAGRAWPVAAAAEALAEGDTLEAITRLRVGVTSRPWDLAAHGRLADLTLTRPGWESLGQLEAFAARVLAPGDAGAWRRWAAALLMAERQDMALPALERYFELGGKQAREDSEAQKVAEGLRKTHPGRAAARPASQPGHPAR